MLVQVCTCVNDDDVVVGNDDDNYDNDNNCFLDLLRILSLPYAVFSQFQGIQTNNFIK